MRLYKVSNLEDTHHPTAGKAAAAINKKRE